MSGERSLCTEGMGMNEVRISYCGIDEEELARAMNILDQGLKEYKKVKGLL